MRFLSAMVSVFCVRSTSKKWFLKIIPCDHETRSIWCHVGVHVDFTSILYSHISLVPQAQCEANLDQFDLFHQWECLKCNGHMPSVLCVKWPLVKLSSHDYQREGSIIAYEHTSNEFNISNHVYIFLVGSTPRLVSKPQISLIEFIEDESVTNP